VIAGVVYADNSRSTMREAPATYETSLPCCGPQPEDIRSYYLKSVVGAEFPEVLIPSVEGTNGFIITDFVCISCELWQDSGEGPIRIAGLPSVQSHAFSTGIPLVVGSVITATSITGDRITVSGYVY